MITHTITGYQPAGTRDPSAYQIDVSYREQRLAEFTGERAFEQALRFVARFAGRAVIHMGDRA